MILYERVESPKHCITNSKDHKDESNLNGAIKRNHILNKQSKNQSHKQHFEIFSCFGIGRSHRIKPPFTPYQYKMRENNADKETVEIN